MSKALGLGRRMLRVSFGLAWITSLAAAACGADKATQPHADAGESSTPQAGKPGHAGSAAGGADDDPMVRPGDAGAGSGGDGSVLPSAGSGGSLGGSGSGGGSGGSVALGGSPPLLPGTGVGTIGRTCAGPADCAPGSTCITANHRLLAGAAPPHGFCSAPCDANFQCTQLSPGALCFPFADDASYCIEGCAFGAPELGEAKCHNRDDFVCNPALMAATASGCDSVDDCNAGELCIDGACNAVLPGCLPTCRGDVDCAPGLYCDQSFLSGTCTPLKPTGKRLGEPCTVPSASQPSEPDGCLGFCQADSAVGNQGHCSATCGLGLPCAWDTASQKFDGACFYPSVLTADTGDVGDFGFCTPTCNCSKECNDATLACSILAQGPLAAEFKGPGLCFSPEASTDELLDCP